MLWDRFTYLESEADKAEDNFRDNLESVILADEILKLMS
jgi:hypothetical protein